LAHYLLKDLKTPIFSFLMEQQLITLYEVGGLTVEECALELGLDEGVARLALAGGSALYRARVENGRETDVSRDEAKEMMGIIKNFARGREDAKPGDRLRAAIYANNEYHGRNDAAARAGAGGNVNVTILTLNKHLAALRASRQQALGAITV
jgi:hypothetical protein